MEPATHPPTFSHTGSVAFLFQSSEFPFLPWLASPSRHYSLSKRSKEEGDFPPPRFFPLLRLSRSRLLTRFFQTHSSHRTERRKRGFFFVFHRLFSQNRFSENAAKPTKKAHKRRLPLSLLPFHSSTDSYSLSHSSLARMHSHIRCGFFS